MAYGDKGIVGLSKVYQKDMIRFGIRDFLSLRRKSRGVKWAASCRHDLFNFVPIMFHVVPCRPIQLHWCRAMLYRAIFSRACAVYKLCRDVPFFNRGVPRQLSCYARPLPCSCHGPCPLRPCSVVSCQAKIVSVTCHTTFKYIMIVPARRGQFDTSRRNSRIKHFCLQRGSSQRTFQFVGVLILLEMSCSL